MQFDFRTEEAGYYLCPHCDLLRPCTEGLKPLDLNISIYHERFDENLEHTAIVNDKRRRKYARLLRRIEERKQTGKFLDIGCGAGRLLVCAAEHGWQAYGSDPAMNNAAEYHAVNPNIHILPKTLSDCEFEDGSFDVVHGNEVIEHIDDLRPVMKEISRILRPGGVAIFRTPHFRSWTTRFVGPHWRGYSVHNGHVSFLSTTSFSRLFEQSGMRLTRVATQHFSLRDRFLPKAKILRSLLSRAYACVDLLARLVNRGERLTVWGEKT